MYEWWNELVIFLLAVFNNWAGYVTGGAVVAVLWLWFSVRQQAMGRFVAIGLAVLFAFLAVFKAWRNEHHSSLEQQAQIASLRNPFFGGEILWPLMAPAGPLGHGSLLTVKADVWNTGAPSIAREFVMSTDLPDGRAIQAKSVIQPQIGKRMTLDMADSQTQVSYDGSETLERQARVFPIPMNGQITDYFQGYFESLSIEDIKRMNLKIKLHFLDINGKPWVIEEKKLIKDSPLFIEPYDLQKRANP